MRHHRVFVLFLTVAPLFLAVAWPSQRRPGKTPLPAPKEQVKALPVPEGAPEAIRSLVEDLAGEGVTVDFQRRVVEVKGVIILDRMRSGYPIEYLIVTQGGYTHEALGMVRCTPSKLNAAFLAMGLRPGRTVKYVKKDPPPSKEELISGEAREFNVIAPAGSVVDVAVRWRDDKGAHLHPIEDLVRYITNDDSLPRRGFVFVGSRFQRVLIGVDRTERFIADVEGNIVSLYLAGSGNCLFDMNSSEGAEDGLYDINPTVSPPRGTKVTFVFALR